MLWGFWGLRVLGIQGRLGIKASASISEAIGSANKEVVLCTCVFVVRLRGLHEVM